jgi:hypothetical protein
MANVEELAKKELVLISTESLMDQSTEGSPVRGRNLLFHGLEPTSSGASKAHGRDTNPNRGMDMVHIEVVLSTCDPELGVFAIEGGEIELGKLTQVIKVR